MNWNLEDPTLAYVLKAWGTVLKAAGTLGYGPGWPTKSLGQVFEGQSQPWFLDCFLCFPLKP